MDTEQRLDIEYYPVESLKSVPFSEAVRVGKILYLAGQIGLHEAGNMVHGGIAAETRQAMENIRTTLKRHGSSLDRIIKVTVMLADMAEWTEMNEVYVSYFEKHVPARSSFGTTGHVLGARVEIECSAVLG